METDEVATFERLRGHRKELFEPEIARHHGRIFKLMGDGLLAEFGSVVDAVECAVALQRGMAERNDGVSQDQRIDVRVGINLGDVIVEGEDRHGDGVNIAARLQQLAEPGGIAVSRTVADHVRHKLAVGFDSLGEHHVKNIAEPIAVFRVAGSTVRGPQTLARLRNFSLQRAAVIALALAVIAAAGLGYLRLRTPPQPPVAALTPDSAIGLPIILVLPLQNLTGDPSQDRLGIGISEDLRDLLWNFAEYQVVSGTSSTASAGESLPDLAKRFGAQFVIEGTLRLSGDKAVVTAQLIDATTDIHVWSTRFEATVSDPVAFEDAVANKLSTSLGGLTGKLREAYERISWAKADADLTQYDYYVRGHTHHMRFTPDEMALARDLYMAGLKRYPDSALLRIKVALADFYFAGWLNAGPENAADVARVKSLVAEAKKLMSARSPSRIEEYYLHWISAYTYQLDRDFAHCLAEAKAAVAVTPYDAWVRGTLSYNLVECGGSAEEAAAWARESIDRQPEGPPHSPEFYLEALAYALYFANHCEDALAVIEGMKDQPLRNLAACQVRLGRLDAARSTMAACLKQDPGWNAKAEAAYPMVKSLQAKWLSDLRAAGLPEG
jgi:TolB-like protein